MYEIPQHENNYYYYNYYYWICKREVLDLNFSHYYVVITPLNQWWKNMQSSRGLKCLVPFPALISSALISNL